MKIWKKIAAGLMAAVMTVTTIPISAIPVRATAAESNSLRLWYDEPASEGTNILSAGQGYSDSDGSNTWQQQTLPIGSGDMGANVYGEIVSEHLTFNEKTLWTGGPSTSRPDYMGGNVQANGQDGAIMQQVQDLFLAGSTSEAVALCNKLIGTSTGYGSYQPWGDIYFDYTGISTSVTDYQRDLDLTTGIASVSFTENGTEYTREYFISHDDNVLVARLEANGSAKLNLNVRFTSKQGGTTVAEGNDTLVLNGQVSDNQLKYASYLTVVPEGGSVTGSGSTLTVSEADAITVYLSAATDYKNTFWNEAGTDDYYYRTGETDAQLAARVSADVAAAVANGYEAVKASHLADYQELFNRVELDLGQTVSEKTTDQLLAAYKNGSATEAEKRQLEVMLFQYGRYLTIASSREDSQLPSNLQGVWNTLTSPPWASDYHMNVNLQMNYWPTYSTNLAECALPLIDYVDSLREPGRITAAIYNGVSSGENEANGFSAHTQNTPFGWTCPGWSFSWGWSPAAVPWILQNCWEYYEYTGDVAFMEEYLYPMMKEEALFYDAILVEDNDGKLVSAPAYSPEHGPYTMGNTYEQSLVWQLYEDVVIAAETLGKDDELVAEWKANQANLKGPIEVGESGQLKEWYEETTIDSMDSQGADSDGHRHISHMLGLFPGDLVQQNDEWVAAAKVSMDYRTDNTTGWGMGQRINTWARLGEGNKAHELIGNLFKGGIYPNLWDAHSPFQIDGNFGMTSGVAEMLVQSNMGYINLLPALPDAWAEGSVDGLVARGNFEIAMDWTKGGITSATILSNNGGVATVKADNVTLAVVTDSDGNEVTYTVTEDGMISFDTVQGKSYTLSIPERPEAPTALTAERADLNTASLTWNAVAGENVTYNVYRQSDSAAPVQIASALTETSYTDSELDTAASIVTYLVTACENGIESIYSNGAAVAAPATYGMIDNLDSRIVYAGGWANWTENVNYNSSIMYLEGSAYSTDATVTLQFIGTGIEIITCTNYDRSYFEVLIDGVSYGEVDTYSASTVRQVTIFTEENLDYGMHTLVIKPLTQNNPSCSRGDSSYKLELDAFNILDTVATAPDEGEVNLNIGDSVTLTDDTGCYAGTDVSALDTSVATVELVDNVTSQENSLTDMVSAVESGKTYVLYNKVAQKLMNNTSADASVGGGGTTGLALSSTKDNFQDSDCWTITAVDGGYYVQDMNGKYLTVASGSAGVSDTEVVISLAYDGTDWTIGESGQYLNDYGGAHSVVAGWSDINDTNSQWEIYEVTSVAVGTTSITFTGVGAGETSVQIGDVIYNITVIDNTVPPVIEPDDDSWDIPLSDLTASCGDYEPDGGSNEGPANLAVDENTATMWHTDWEGTSRENHWFQFEVAGDYAVNGLRYLPRQTGNSNGTITQYAIMISDDGVNFTTVAEGTWDADSTWKIAQFTPVKTKYVRLVSIDAVTDNSWVFASAAELRLTYQPTEVSDADKTELNALIAECELIEQGNYSAKTWQQFQKALDAASTISANPYASQAQVDEALAALAEAKAGLKEQVPGEGPHKILHLDAGRKYFSKDWIIALVNELSAAGYTHLQLAFGNNGMRFLLDDMTIEANGTTYASDDIKAGIKLGNDNYGALTGYVTGDNHALTEAEMDEIIAHAKSVGIEIIPHLNMPGHMSALLDAMVYVGIEDAHFTGSVESDSSVNLNNETALNFMTALVDKYAAYFAEKGCSYFHIGADEYANDAYNGNMGFPSMGATLYQKFADFVNGNAAIVKAHGMTPIAWNDGIYYGSYTAEFDTDIVIDYWSSGWWGYTLARASSMDEKGHGLINTNGDYYYILGKDDRFTTGTTTQHDPNLYTECAGYDLNSFMDGSTIENPLGGMFCVWADYPGAETEQEVGANIRLVLRAMALRMDGLELDGMNTDVVPGGFNEDGTINESGETPHEHSFGEWTVTTEPTCTAEGVQTRTCECGESETRTVAALGHTEAEAVTENNVDATCTADGSYDSVVYCSVCDAEISRETVTVPALGHTEAAAVTENNVDATCTADGSYDSVVYCSVCDAEISRETVTVPALGHDWQDGTCTICGEQQPAYQNPFEDVSESSYYYDAVLWAAQNDIVAGVDSTHFAPDAACTRAQVVTFLWRAAGKPEPQTNNNPFTDVSENNYYYKAVLWGVEQGIVAGISATKFAPNSQCTRAQVIAFLWRANGRPDSDAEIGFVDVPSGAYYTTAVAWAVENGITSGIGNNRFGVNNTCTRAQIVSFLYRAQ